MADAHPGLVLIDWFHIRIGFQIFFQPLFIQFLFFLHFLIRILLIITIEIFVGNLALLCQLVEGVFRDVWTTFWSKKFHDCHVS